MIRDIIGDRASWQPGGTASVQTAIMLGQLPDVVLINFSHSTFFRDAGIAPMATLEIERRKALES